MCDLNLQPTKSHFYLSRSTTVPIILKSMHKCTSYGLDKLHLCSFYHLTFKCDLDLQPTRTNVSNGTSTPQGKQLCQIILKSMHKCINYGPDKSGRTDTTRRMHACMYTQIYIHRTEVVTTTVIILYIGTLYVLGHLLFWKK